MENIQSIWPQWQVVELIGQGAFGKVYKIKREELGNISLAAMKIITLPQDQSEVRELMNSGMDYQSVRYYYEDLVRNLQNEICVMETLKTGNNIVSIEDYAFSQKEDGIGWSIYIRMELLKNLNTYLEEVEQKLSAEEVIKLGEDVCQALYCCEQSKVIHRDIKPDNVFRNRYGDYKLGDFGIAKQMEMTKSVYSQKGTSMYMAPEVYRGEHYDKTVDIYSLGIMLYKLLNYGRFPFMPSYPERLRPADAEEAMRKRINGELMPPPALAGEILAAVVMKACSLIPGERYQSALELKNALGACRNKMGSVSRNRINKEEATGSICAETHPDIKQEVENKVAPLKKSEKTEHEIIYHWSDPVQTDMDLKTESDTKKDGSKWGEHLLEKISLAMCCSTGVKILLAIHIALLCWWVAKIYIIAAWSIVDEWQYVIEYSNPDLFSRGIAFLGTLFICLGCIHILMKTRVKRGINMIFTGANLLAGAVILNGIIYGAVTGSTVTERFLQWNEALANKVIGTWVIAAIPYFVYLYCNCAALKTGGRRQLILEENPHKKLSTLIGMGAASKRFKLRLLISELLIGAAILFCTLEPIYSLMSVFSIVLSAVFVLKKNTTAVQVLLIIVSISMGICELVYPFIYGISLGTMLPYRILGEIFYMDGEFMIGLGMSLSNLLILRCIWKILMIWPRKQNADML